MYKTQNIEQFSYPNLLAQVKERVKLAQQRAIYAANDELLRMYWDIGHILYEEKKKIGWGNGALKRLSEELQHLMPQKSQHSSYSQKRARKLLLQLMKKSDVMV